MNEAEKANILIVDDRPENLLALESLLESPSLNIIKANSGNEALGLVLEHDFALILLDVQMPEMDGFEATHVIRGGERSARVPIIAMTANAMQGDRERCLAAGMDDYLSKPISVEALAGALERVGQEGRHLRSKNSQEAA